MNKLLKSLMLMMLLISSSSFADCKKPMSQWEMNECSSLEYKEVDKELNDVYKQLMSKLNVSEKEKLKIEQRKWIVFRDSSAKESISDISGTMASGIYSSSLTHHTKNRIKELKALLAKKESGK
jgi:uncharacterized protein YecT (DUF1311 family)